MVLIAKPNDAIEEVPLCDDPTFIVLQMVTGTGEIRLGLQGAKLGTRAAAEGAGKAGLIDSVKSGKTPVIGKMKDLETIGTKEIRVADYLPNKGDPKLNWQQNSSVLRQVMNEGKPIRDASPFSGKITNDFLGMERNLLQDHAFVEKRYDDVILHYSKIKNLNDVQKKRLNISLQHRGQK